MAPRGPGSLGGPGRGGLIGRSPGRHASVRVVAPYGLDVARRVGAPVVRAAGHEDIHFQGKTVSDLVQIVYVSRSTFTTMPPERGIEPSVARILAQSRVNNARRGLVGALYFGDGCFFQCLEGRTAEVERLYAALLQDPRHTDLKVLIRRPIERTGFETWAMKYVPLDAEMKALLRELGMPTFDPYRFDDATVARVLDMLGSGHDLEPGPATVEATQTRDTAPTPSRGDAARAPWAIPLAIAVAIALAVGIAVAMGAFD